VRMSFLGKPRIDEKVVFFIGESIPLKVDEL
jgi:hypothetical protein